MSSDAIPATDPLSDVMAGLRYVVRRYGGSANDGALYESGGHFEAPTEQ